MPKRIAVIWGYFTKNLGDDLMLKAFLNKTKGKYKKIYIQSHKKNKSYYSTLGVNVITVDSFAYRGINKLLHSIGMADIYYFFAKKNTDFIMLGGSLFAESTKTVSESQYKNLAYAVNHAKHSYVIGSNFGPYNSEQFINRYIELFKKCDDVCVRDCYSFNLFVNLPNVRYAPDIIFSGEWENKPQQSVTSNSIVISVINLKNRLLLSKKTELYEKMLSDLAIYHAQNGSKVILASFCDFEGDREACNRIKHLCGDLSNIDIITYNDIGFLKLFQSSRKIYGTRFHSIILALYYGIDCIPLVYNEKTQNALTSYCKSFKSIDLMHLEDYTVDDIVKFDSQIELLPDIKKKAKQQFEGVRK